MKDKIKILIINNIAHPSMTAIINELTKYKDYIWAYMTASGKNSGYWNYEENIKVNKLKVKVKYLPTPFMDSYSLFINPDGYSQIKNYNPSIIIINGWDIFIYWQALIYAKKYNRKIILISGSTKNESTFIRLLAKPLVSYFIKNIDYVLTYGKRSQEYMLSLGMSKTKIYTGIYPADNSAFINPKNIKGEKEELKKKLGISSLPTFLYVGQLIKRKNIQTLLKSFSKVSQKSNLLIVGSGSEEEKLKRLVILRKIENVFFLGFVERDELPSIYSLADVFVLSSLHEVWGLVVNEAMFSSLPLIVSSKAGCVDELVRVDINGLTFNPKSEKELTRCMNSFLHNRKKRNQMGIQSKKLIQDVTPKSFANKLISIIEKCNFFYTT